MIILTLKDILEGQETLQKLSEKPLPGRTAFQIGRMLKKLEVILNQYNETKLQLLNKYAKHKENNELDLNDKGECQFSQENIKLYVNEIDKIISEQIELDVMPMNLEDLEQLTFTPSEMARLDPFIKE